MDLGPKRSVPRQGFYASEDGAGLIQYQVGHFPVCTVAAAPLQMESGTAKRAAAARAEATSAPGVKSEGSNFPCR